MTLHTPSFYHHADSRQAIFHPFLFITTIILYILSRSRNNSLLSNTNNLKNSCIYKKGSLFKLSPWHLTFPGCSMSVVKYRTFHCHLCHCVALCRASFIFCVQYMWRSLISEETLSYKRMGHLGFYRSTMPFLVKTSG